MNTNTAHDVQCEKPDSSFMADLCIALVSPNEKRRAAAAESACEFCEFASYLNTPADQARLSQLQYDVILVDIDGDTEKALKLVESLSSDGRTNVLVYSSEKSFEKLARCMHAGARDFLAFPFQPDAVIEALRRLSAPHPATCSRRDQSEPRKFSANRESNWPRIFGEGRTARSQARQ